MKSNISSNFKKITNEEIIELLKCNICLEVAHDPVMELENQHLFCRDCIEHYFELTQSKKCPVCKVIIVKIDQCLIANQILSLIDQKCEFCDLSMTLDKYPDHLQNNCEKIKENYSEELSNVVDKMKSILDLEINNHLEEYHKTIYQTHVNNWNWLNTDRKDWKWWWWANNEWWNNTPCDICNKLWKKYEDDVEFLERKRIKCLKYLN